MRFDCEVSGLPANIAVFWNAHNKVKTQSRLFHVVKFGQTFPVGMKQWTLVYSKLRKLLFTIQNCNIEADTSTQSQTRMTLDPPPNSLCYLTLYLTQIPFLTPTTTTAAERETLWSGRVNHCPSIAEQRSDDSHELWLFGTGTRRRWSRWPWDRWGRARETQRSPTLRYDCGRSRYHICCPQALRPAAAVIFSFIFPDCFNVCLAPESPVCVVPASRAYVELPGQPKTTSSGLDAQTLQH